VNMQDEYPGPVEAYERLGMEQLWLPTIDHYEPRLEDLQQACDFIERYRAKGERVYIHCKAGHDRSAAVALAWMAYSRRVLNEEDLRLLNEELFEKRQVRATLYEQPNLQAFAEWIRHGGADRTWERPAGLSAELAEAAAAAAGNAAGTAAPEVGATESVASGGEAAAGGDATVGGGGEGEL